MPAVNGDRTRLLAVFQNLMHNAVKFMGDQAAPRIERYVRGAGELGLVGSGNDRIQIGLGAVDDLAVKLFIQLLQLNDPIEQRRRFEALQELYADWSKDVAGETQELWQTNIEGTP